MAEHIRIDGRHAAELPADDRGLAYGDGVFRTLRIESGQPIGWDEHWRRLQHDCAALDIATPGEAEIRADIRALFATRSDGVCKVMVTRGSGGRGYMPPVPAAPRRIVVAHALPAHANAEPLALARSSIELAVQPRLAGIKHLNRLEQVLARSECDARGVADTWMADSQGFIIATTMRNLFFVDANGCWLTPRLTRAGIIGATRQRLWRALAQAGRPVRENDIRLSALIDCRAAIACNSVGGAVAVSHFEGRALPDSHAQAQYAQQLLRQPSAGNTGSDDRKYR
ncbi:aminodeoxychorismate lyase [Salinisphaera sp. S4-8]|uniref:aminodeoxychorismate lyase n=1 Tax=Salinisphaera sp. S4-8 TaxID=633357 RepID=UPI003341FF44